MARTRVREAQRRRVSMLPGLYVGWRTHRQYRTRIHGGHLELAGHERIALAARDRPCGRNRHVRAMLREYSTSGTGYRQSAVQRKGCAADDPVYGATSREMDAAAENGAEAITRRVGANRTRKAGRFARK